MKSMREYHDLYLKSDILLLADVLENFQDVCMSNYGLDPCWYYTSPRSFVGRIIEDHKHLFREYYRSRHVSFLPERNQRRNFHNNHKIRRGEQSVHGSEYDPEKLTKYITYLDANNLYRWAMSNPLPPVDLSGWKKSWTIGEMSRARWK